MEVQNHDPGRSKGKTNAWLVQIHIKAIHFMEPSARFCWGGGCILVLFPLHALNHAEPNSDLSRPPGPTPLFSPPTRRARLEKRSKHVYLRSHTRQLMQLRPLFVGFLCSSFPPKKRHSTLPSFKVLWHENDQPTHSVPSLFEPLLHSLQAGRYLHTQVALSLLGTQCASPDIVQSTSSPHTHQTFPHSRNLRASHQKLTASASDSDSFVTRSVFSPTNATTTSKSRSLLCLIL